MDKDIVEALRRSKLRFGSMYPVLKARDGTVIDGNHRLAADPNWKSITLSDIESEEQKALAMIACNFVRREVSREEKTAMIGALAKLGWNAKRIEEETGIPLRTVYDHLPGETKKPTGPKGPRNREAKIAGAAISEPGFGRSTRDEQESDESEKRAETYRKGLSPRTSEHRKPTFTKPVVAVANVLQGEGAELRLEEPFERKDELTNSGESEIEAMRREREKFAASGRVILVPQDQLENIAETAEGEEEQEPAPLSIQAEAKQNQGIIQLHGAGVTQKIMTNPKNMLYYDYARRRWPNWAKVSDFSDFANDCIEYFMRKHHIRVKVGEEFEPQ